MENMINQRLKWFVYFVSAVCFIIAAFKSTGYYHFDEHYQIIEFALLKLGKTRPEDLAWEYAAKIRSTFQPTLVYLLFGGLKYAGVSSPYTLALILRLITGACYFTSVYFFIGASSHYFKANMHLFYIGISYMFWFIPFINVHFSSEIFAGIFFLAALSVSINPKLKTNTDYLLIGFFLAISFLCRFQTALLSVGLIGYLIFIEKTHRKCLIMLIGTGLAVLLIGFMIDCWFYGEVVFTPYQYYYYNIVKKVAAAFGIAPWYYYFTYVFRSASYPLGFVILAALIYTICSAKYHIFSFVLIPFLLVHCIIEHKEGRFLFPIISLVPFMVTALIQSVTESLPRLKLARMVFYLFGFLLVGINILMLLLCTFKPAGPGRQELTAFIEKYYQNKPLTIYFNYRNNPYDPLDVPEKFYGRGNVKFQVLTDICQMEDLNFENRGRTVLFCTNTYNLDLSICKDLLKLKKFKQVASGVPPWIEKWKIYYPGPDADCTLVLYENKFYP
ncbi:glycosyltransferase family protein [Pedobacter suwonensis]|uniref:hypothetical protein n=1 Tax=Pedobacter suwonensis TaxID=332999 RepID=UPI0011A99ED8|nr:hypothetical protein [Pedobacter suwonensis]